jgi:DNA end-binding protein Ku
VPVKVYSAIEDHDVPLHQVHAADGGRIRYQRICELDGEVALRRHRQGVRRRRAHRGAHGRGPRVAPRRAQPRDRGGRVRAQRPDRSADARPAYYLEPDSSSPKAYVLLRQTLEQTDRTAIVRFSLRQKTRWRRCGCAATCSCCRRCSGPTRCARRRSRARRAGQDLREGARAVGIPRGELLGDFDPEQFVDEYQQELRTLIDASSRRATRSTRRDVR